MKVGDWVTVKGQRNVSGFIVEHDNPGRIVAIEDGFAGVAVPVACGDVDYVLCALAALRPAFAPLVFYRDPARVAA